MILRDYSDFKKHVWDRYEPFPYELMREADGFAPGASAARRWAPRYWHALRVLTPHLRDGASVLDVGAFPGTFVKLLQQSGISELRVSACGMPVVPEFARDLEELGIPFAACNVDPDIVSPGPFPVGLPYESSSFDVVTVMEVVEHLYSLKTVLTDSFRVLRPGGALYLTTNNILDRVALLRLLRSGDTNLDQDIDQTSIWSDHRDQWRGHVRFFSLKQLKEVARRAGFVVTHSSGVEVYEDPDVYRMVDRPLAATVRRWLVGDGSRPPWRPRQSLRLWWYLGTKVFGNAYNSHIEVVARKPS